MLFLYDDFQIYVVLPITPVTLCPRNDLSVRAYVLIPK